MEEDPRFSIFLSLNSKTPEEVPFPTRGAPRRGRKEDALLKQRLRDRFNDDVLSLNKDPG